MIDGRRKTDARAASLALLTLLAASGCSPRSTLDAEALAAMTPLPMSYFVADVFSDRATLWARCGSGDEIVVDLAPGDGEALRAPVDRDRDRTARLELRDLQPGQRYRYSIWCAGGQIAAPSVGTFRTPPAPDEHAPVRFAWFGDVGGQNVCRDADRGYLPFQQVLSTLPDFSIALGDMIYVDDACLARGRYGNDQVVGPPAPASTLDEYRAHWRYGRADRYLQRALAGSGTYPVWDDHEIRNDAGPAHDHPPYRPWVDLIPTARRAFLEYNPIAADDPSAPLYRSVRWGRHLEMFLLDTRSHRDGNGEYDHPGKTLLGAEQKRWLLDGLQASDATWKIVVSSVPISVPTGSDAIGRDGWASGDSDLGFETELREILQTMQRLTKRQIVWITTDAHFGTVMRYTPFPRDPDFVIHEVVTGPLQAGVFPRSERDPTFHPETLYQHGPADGEAIDSLPQAMRWFNFGWIEIDAAGSLVAEIVTGTGERAYRLELRP